MRTYWMGAASLALVALYSSEYGFPLGSRAQPSRSALTVVDVFWAGIEPWETLRVTIRNDGIYPLRAEIRFDSESVETAVLSPGSECSADLSFESRSIPIEIQVREKLDYVHPRFIRARVTRVQQVRVPPRE